MSTAFTRTQRGLLELTFDAPDGRTRLARDRQQGPLKVVRPFETDDGGLLLYVINPTAGVLGGDRFELRLELGPGARVVLLSQSAQKVHRMHPGEHATQRLEARLAAGSRLELYPERVIPFAASSFAQDSCFLLEPGAQLGLLESFASGRVAHGEHWSFERLAGRTEVRLGDRLIYLDRFDLRPNAHSLGHLGLMEDGRYWASGLFVGEGTPAPPPLSLPWGRTASGHLWLRGLERSGLALEAAMRHSVNRLRGAFFGLGPLMVRR